MQVRQDPEDASRSPADHLLIGRTHRADHAQHGTELDLERSAYPEPQTVLSRVAGWAGRMEWPRCDGLIGHPISSRTKCGT